MRIKLLLCFTVLGLVFGCKQNVQKAPPQNLEQSIALITLGFADSVTEQNNRHGISRCLYIDVTNEKFILYTKFLEFDSVNRSDYFERKQISGSLKGIKDNSAVKHYLINIKSLPNGNLIPNFTDGALHCGASRLTIVKSGNVEKRFFTYGNQYAFELFEEVDALSKLPINKKSISTRVTLNEDSILVPVLTRPEFSTLHPGLPMPDSPPPPPAIRRNIKFTPPPSKN
jgi:hypothetical protein